MTPFWSGVRRRSPRHAARGAPEGLFEGAHRAAVHLLRDRHRQEQQGVQRRRCAEAEGRREYWRERSSRLAGSTSADPCHGQDGGRRAARKASRRPRGNADHEREAHSRHRSQYEWV